MKYYDLFVTVSRAIKLKLFRKSKQITLLSNGVIAIFLIVCVCALAYPNSDFTRAMWVWDYETSLSSEETREQLLLFSEEHGITVLFLGAERALAQHAVDYVDFIEEAHERDIKVMALGGNPKWALAEHHDDALAMVNRVLAFNASYPWAAFDGIQLDIEPYTMPGFFQERESISEQLLDVLKEVKHKLEAADETLELNAAIPFWYATGYSSVVLNYNEEEKPLSHHILDIVDSVSIMAYRNHAEGQINVAKADLTYASKVGKKAYIGTETNPPQGDSIPAIVTYYNDQISSMQQQLRQVEQRLSWYEGFAGVAIHHYDSYKEMIERERQ